VISTSKDDSFSGNVKNVLVIVAFAKPDLRRVFEREYVIQLSGYGVDAVPGYEILSDIKIIDKDTILSKIEDLGIDSVLITSLVSNEKVTTEYNDWYGYYNDGYRSPYQDIFNIETVLFDVKNEKLIWSILSMTMILDWDNRLQEIQPFVKTILQNLSKDKLI
jgi:hypothetical protein